MMLLDDDDDDDDELEVSSTLNHQHSIINIHLLFF